MRWKFIHVKWLNSVIAWWIHYYCNKNLNKSNEKVKLTCKVVLVVYCIVEYLYTFQELIFVGVNFLVWEVVLKIHQHYLKLTWHWVNIKIFLLINKTEKNLKVKNF